MIRINFASRNYRVLDRVFQGLVLGAAALCLVMAVILGKAALLRRDIAALDKSVKEIQSAEERIKPLLDERDRLVKDLAAMAALVQARGFSWTQLLSNLERVVPIGVALRKVEYEPKTQTLSLDGAAQSPESLRNLMVGLERTSGFRNAYLKHQSVEKRNISFNVVVLYQEPKTGAVVQGK